MKVGKIVAVLYIYHRLCAGGFSTRNGDLVPLEISVPTFHRYTREIRRYLTEFEPDKMLFYSRREDAYFLKNK
jgi:hypothetical protein